jgi:hypothetical protein
MDLFLIDYLVVLFALVFFAFVSAIYLMRFLGRSKLESKLSLFLSVQLVPFFALWLINPYLQQWFYSSNSWISK